jgi:hypothetical protein
VDNAKAPDYSQPGGAVHETTIPAGIAAIHVIASLHALVTLELLGQGAAYAPGFTSMLLTLKRVAGVFEDAFRPYKFCIARATDCLICGPAANMAESSPENLDVALEHALARLGGG